MKKSMIFWMFAAVLAMTGLTSCSDDDDFYEKDYNYKSAIVGTWYLASHSSGWGGITDYNVGQIVVTFTKKGEVKVVNNGISPATTSTYTYSFKKIERSIFTGEPATVITFNDSSFYFYINFDNGVLYISAEVYDGDGYALKKMPK
ncbi:MAG: hypothetical protein IKX65_04600 [Prevotella sp.]|nr:hypothetical protein [Prevotella sp.]